MGRLRRPLHWDLMAVQERMNRLFDELFSQSPGGGRQVGRWSPPVDIYETESAIIILVEVPGIAEEDLDIEISNNAVTLKGERRLQPGRENETVHCLERAHGPFQRTFSLPSEVAQDQAKATLKAGLLKVALPKVKGLSHGVKIERK